MCIRNKQRFSISREKFIKRQKRNFHVIGKLQLKNYCLCCQVQAYILCVISAMKKLFLNKQIILSQEVNFNIQRSPLLCPFYLQKRAILHFQNTFIPLIKSCISSRTPPRLYMKNSFTHQIYILRKFSLACDFFSLKNPSPFTPHPCTSMIYITKPRG